MVPTTTSSYESQFQNVIQWFREFSEMQKSDFVDIIAFAIDPDLFPGGRPGHKADLNPRPASIYQIRENFFLEWFSAWDKKQKDDLLEELRSIDGDFMSKVDAVQAAGPRDPSSTGGADDIFVADEVLIEDLMNNVAINGEGDASETLQVDQEEEEEEDDKEVQVKEDETVED